MKNLEIKSAVACDDIRQEVNGKFLLIGVYGAEIAVPQLPVDFVLSYWILVIPKDLMEHVLELRLINEANVVLIGGKFQFKARDLKPGLMPFSGMVFQAQSEGVIRFQLRESGVDEAWETVHEIPIVVRSIRRPPSEPNVSTQPSSQSRRDPRDS